MLLQFIKIGYWKGGRGGGGKGGGSLIMEIVKTEQLKTNNSNTDSLTLVERDTNKG